MNRLSVIFARTFATVLSLALVNVSIPMGGITHLAPDPNAPKPAPAPEKPKPKTSRPLSAKEMGSMQGKLGKNPYLAGGSKWDVNFKGVNLLNGVFSTAGTDLTFEGGYGIPINVTRSYSSSNPDEGPLGEGWTLSVDIRNTAGGLLKSSGAPVRSVPVSFKERPALVHGGDPRIPDANQPVEAVIATDAGGTEETIQKDADGILTTPSWDKNRNISEYETVTVGNALYQILKRNIVTTPEGTVYVYEKKGAYTGGGMVPWDDDEADPTPCNVLKIVSATDRHGNVTTYHYGLTDVTFSKSNGTTSEKRLESIEMPNGHEIEFTWGNGSNAPVNRIRTATDGVRTVTYGYTGGLLTSVETPGGKTTTYTYGTSVDYDTFGSPEIHGNLLTSITDPRGLTTSIAYAAGQSFVDPYGIPVDSAVAWQVTHPNGVKSEVHIAGIMAPYSVYHGPGPLPTRTRFYDYAGGQATSGGALATFVSSSNPWFKIRVGWTTSIGATNMELGPFNPFDDMGLTVAWSKTYNALSQNLLEEENYNYGRPVPTSSGGLWEDRRMVVSSNVQRTGSSTAYNFLGNPLEKTVWEKTYNSSLSQLSSRTATVGYAYWGHDKYYQQKAVKDQAGRVSFTDYFDWNATQGKKGQTYRVYDQKRTNFLNKTANDWRYTVVPEYATTFSAEFDYDAKGRPTDVWKIQKTTTNPWTYVQTKTTYGSDGSPTWGAATQVVEDYGGINRTTNTLAYDSIGRAIEVQDASGKQFETTYDLDGVVQSVYRVDSSLNQMIMQYSYGTTGLLNGMVTQIEDGLSGVVQDFTYETTGGGKGNVASVTETNGNDDYTVSYAYNAAGERESVVYDTQNGVTSYKYTDYIPVGNPSSPSRVFQTLNKTVSGVSTAEEFHYQYDSSGRLTNSAFAQTPQVGGGAPSSAPFYTAGYPADTRARAFYTYDAGGRVVNVEHWWDEWNGTNAYISEAILGASYSYELSSSNRGLRTGAAFYVKDPNEPSQFIQEWTESYGYDSDLDYQTSATYTDGQPNANQTWSYDAAGNRNDATVVDNLNRATTIGGVARTYDILGNTLTKGDSNLSWDALNRMTQYLNGDNPATDPGWNYQYRSDGMRVKKANQNYNDWATWTKYIYDGQMPVEETEYTQGLAGSSTKVRRNGLGARGIDRLETVATEGTSVSYPIYDGHGNMVATLVKNGSGYTVGNRRSFGAWGEVRQGSASGDPKGRYVANLGHVQDDESDLIYMRARYYEVSCGRFVNEDPARSGFNWYSYAGNNPTNNVDQDGKFAINLGLALAGFVIGFLTGGISALLGGQTGIEAFKASLAGGIGGFAAGLFPMGAFGSGAISAFVSSIMGDVLSGKSIRWGRAFLAAGVGGLTGAILNAVASIGAKSEMMSKLTELIDDCDQFDEILGLLCGNVTSSAFDAFDP